MTTLDQRILVPASPDTIWKYISDIANNPHWQVDCRSISFLTSMRSGPGVRWRSTNKSGGEHVLEITAWYEGLGYEYTVVDGMPYKQNRGRIRLQETPEGTIVQWTFNYELGGVFGGVRNTLSKRRQIEAAMIDNLRMLWRIITQSKTSQTVYESKALMRDAPDVEERSQYKPRHPSAVQQPKPEPESSPVIMEPPVSDEDTRPRPAVAASQSKQLDEPDFLSGVRDFEKEPTTTSEPEAGSDVAGDVLFKRPPAPQETQQPLEPLSPLEEQLVKPVKSPGDELSEPEPEAPASVPIPDPIPEQETTGDPVPRRDASKLDTGQVSVFEVFGLPKPSETQELSSVSPQVEPSEETSTLVDDTQPTVIVPMVKPEHFRRIGLRLILRQRLIKLRRL